MKGKITKKGHQLLHEYEDEILLIEPWGIDGLRIRSTIRKRIEDTSWALTESVHDGARYPEKEIRLSVSDTDASIRNGRISARLTDIPTQVGYLQFYKEDQLLLSEYDYVVHAHNPGTRTYKQLNGLPDGDELSQSEVSFSPQENERFFGLGLNATGSVNLKGSIIDLYQRHVKHVIPFVVSSSGYGLLWNNPSLGRVELGINRTRWVSEGCKQIDYYITTGNGYAEIMSHYADVTGHPPPLPYWASGFWQCKLRYKTQNELLKVAREFQRRGLPLSVIVIDFRHWIKTGDWTLDPQFWPDPKAMIAELDEMGVRVMISPWVLVEEESCNFRPMEEQEMFLSRIDGSENWQKFQNADGSIVRTRQYDPTNPTAAAFLWDKWKRNYVDLGIRTFWLDPCDDLSPINEYDQLQYHAGPSREVHCYYPIAHQKTVYDGLREAGEQEVVTICRSSWAGSQRYGASPAAHDIESSFEHLAEYLKAGLNLSMSGIPWGAAEIGGFVTSDNSSDRFHELMVRWYQYGVFTPIFRTHGHRPNNEAWNIGGDSYRYIRAAMILRERLRPYIMQIMMIASKNGIPPMRPLFFDFEEDEQTYQVEDQFLFGSELMAAPITAYQSRSRTVYLPSGLSWIDVWTGHQFEGGQSIEAAAPLENIPVYLRGSTPQLCLSLFQNLY